MPLNGLAAPVAPNAGTLVLIAPVAPNAGTLVLIAPNAGAAVVLAPKAGTLVVLAPNAGDAAFVFWEPKANRGAAVVVVDVALVGDCMPNIGAFNPIVAPAVVVTSAVGELNENAGVDVVTACVTTGAADCPNEKAAGLGVA